MAGTDAASAGSGMALEACVEEGMILMEEEVRVFDQHGTKLDLLLIHDARHPVEGASGARVTAIVRQLHSSVECPTWCSCRPLLFVGGGKAPSEGRAGPAAADAGQASGQVRAGEEQARSAEGARCHEGRGQDGGTVRFFGA